MTNSPKSPPPKPDASSTGSATTRGWKSAFGRPFGKNKPRKRSFTRRLLLAVGLSFALIGFALGLGIFGYRYIAGFGWVDSLLNASMILSGMGPVGTLNTDSAKVFASAYALFSGLVFIGATGILLTPIFHRVLHRFHIEEKDVQ